MEEIRKYIVQIVFVLVGLVYAIKLFQIQILDSTYKLAADNNVIRRETRYAYRGLIYDRNGKLLVHNEPAFDLMVVPREVRVADTVRFCRLLGITKDSFIQRIKDARSFDLHQPSVFMKMISPAEFARFGDHLVDFSGFYIQPRSLRGYDYPVFANGLGYIGEVSKEQLARDTSGYYRQGDYIGVSGLEAYYEKELRGQNGVQYNMVNVRGVVKGPFRNGRYDTLSVAGLNLVSSIDVDLQAYGEWLFENLAGAVVAIEPSSGEILALVSAPSYDPSMLSGRLVGENFATLTQDSLTPLYNRSIMSFQPPGSTFKPLQSLIALQEGVLGPEERIFCSGGLVGDHAPPGYYSVFSAIQHSPTTSSTSYSGASSTAICRPTPSSIRGSASKRGTTTSTSSGSAGRSGWTCPMKKAASCPRPRITTASTAPTAGNGRPSTPSASGRARCSSPRSSSPTTCASWPTGAITTRRISSNRSATRANPGRSTRKNTR
jgi:penicillin-binding protein 2